MSNGVDRRSANPRWLRSPEDFAAGAFLLAIAALGFLGSIGLAFGTLRNIGPGMLPRSVAALVAAFGATLIASSFVSQGSRLERWSIRGPFYILGAAILFGWTIRPLGLVIAGPLAILFSSMADRNTRPLEIIIFAAVLTAICIGIFHYLLRLPIPIMPTRLPYPLDQLI